MSMVACGWRHTISVSYSGALYTYGWSKYGQLGHGDLEDHLIPHKLEALSNSFISQVSLRPYKSVLKYKFVHLKYPTYGIAIICFPKTF